MPRRRPGSRRWLDEHFRDPFVQAAHAQGYRSRAAFKLEEILAGNGLLTAGMTVVDLGAAPGGWSQVAVLGGGGVVVAVDLLPMDPLAGVSYIQGDFLEEAVLAEILALLPTGKADLILSDMAPNMTGIKSVDQPRGERLAEAAFAFAGEVLRPGGGMVIKLFQGPGFHDLVAEGRRVFERARVVKPKASRGRSAESYLVAQGYSQGEKDSA